MKTFCTDCDYCGQISTCYEYHGGKTCASCEIKNQTPEALAMLTVNWLMSFHAGDTAQVSHRMCRNASSYPDRYLSTFSRYSWHNCSGILVVKYLGVWSAYLIENGVPVMGLY